MMGMKNTREIERLPFTVRVVTDPADLEAAVSIRKSAYGRHVPTLAATMNTVEEMDTQPGCKVLLATSNLDGEPLGTMRIQTNRYAPLCVEKSVALPNWLADDGMAEASRLGICLGKTGRLVKVAIFKAFYLYCIENQITWMIATGRRPVYRDYKSLMMEDVFPEREMIPMAHVGDIPHRVMFLKAIDVESKWKEARHPLYHYFFNLNHPEIQVQADEDFSSQIQEPLGEYLSIAN